MFCSIDGGLTYNIDRAELLGITEEQNFYLYLIYGIFNIIGRIGIGQLSDILESRIFSLTACSMVAYNIIFMTSVTFDEFWSQAIWFGVFMGSYGGLSSMMIVLIRSCMICNFLYHYRQCLVFGTLFVNRWMDGQINL